MGRGPALAAVLVPQSAGTAQPEAGLLGVRKRGRSWRRTRRARWPSTPRAFIWTGIAWAPGGTEPAEQHREKRHEHDERRVGERRKVKARMHLLWDQNRISLLTASR